MFHICDPFDVQAVKNFYEERSNNRGGAISAAEGKLSIFLK
jgi:hypothetical protein